jgi:hypothetical protein
VSETGGSFGGKGKFQPGGTPGGAGSFLVGLLLMAAGVFMVFERVTVHTSFWRFFGSPQTSFGVSLLPLLIGIGRLSFDGKSVIGWMLAVGGIVLILVGVLMNLDIYFQPTSLTATIIMFGLITAGIGLFARGLRPHATDR